MVGRPLRRRTATVLMVFVTLGLALATPALGQTPSDADTMRILDAAALPGDTVAIDFFLRNVNVLGAYNFRLRFDPSLIEPLTDTTLSDTSTVFPVEARQLRGTSFELFGGTVKPSGVVLFVALDFGRMPGTDTLFLPGGGVAARLSWRVRPSATPQTTSIAFENDSLFPQSWNTTADIDGQNLKRPVLVAGSFTILACNCASQGDANDNGLSYEMADAVFLISYAFRGAPAPLKDASCYHANRGEITCDGVVDVMDVVEMIDVIVGLHPPTCDPCSCSPYPGGCP